MLIIAINKRENLSETPFLVQNALTKLRRTHIEYVNNGQI